MLSQANIPPSYEEIIMADSNTDGYRPIYPTMQLPAVLWGDAITTRTSYPPGGLLLYLSKILGVLQLGNSDNGPVPITVTPRCLSV